MKRYLNKFLLSLMMGILFVGMVSCNQNGTQKIRITFDPNGGDMGYYPSTFSIVKGITLEGILPKPTR